MSEDEERKRRDGRGGGALEFHPLPFRSFFLSTIEVRRSGKGRVFSFVSFLCLFLSRRPIHFLLSYDILGAFYLFGTGQGGWRRGAVFDYIFYHSAKSGTDVATSHSFCFVTLLCHV